jgi:hypothetical protein
MTEPKPAPERCWKNDGGTLQRVPTQVTHPQTGEVITGTKVVCSKCN